MPENLSPAVTLTREQKEQRRLAAAQDIREGEMTQAEIAEEHGVTQSAVSDQVKPDVGWRVTDHLSDLSFETIDGYDRILIEYS